MNSTAKLSDDVNGPMEIGMYTNAGATYERARARVRVCGRAVRIHRIIVHDQRNSIPPVYVAPWICRKNHYANCICISVTNAVYVRASTPSAVRML